MFNQLLSYKFVTILPFIALLISALIYQVNKTTTPAVLSEQLEIKTVTSLAIAGDRMPMKHRVDGEIAVDKPLQLLLQFSLSAGQMVALDFVDSEQFQINQTTNTVYSTDDQGRVTITLHLTPLVAGKIYIKFLASTTDGEQLRSFSIPLRVKDNEGLVPVTEYSPKPRVNLPVKGTY
ncbi:hypothetical protein BST96_18520 [Oceanicoccus sagamiensis]|uniref:Uncharacterized protein n=2 Tax=Oceanicoccus sagamiensis TaxID=716816 RepID=A0A1X9NED8_9GAMM|nr:hypothetical protein BST96_18520 [Oceanicoccus sagamiensis]